MMNYMEKLELIAKLMTEVDASIWKGVIYTGRDEHGPKIVLTGVSPSKWEVTGKPS